MAFSSATHDIAADGFYMLGLKQYQQAAFVGVRTIFYRIAMIAAKGVLVVLAGTLETRGFSVASAWSVTFYLLAAIMLALCVYHLFVLPYPATDGPVPRDPSRSASAEFFRGFVIFFKRKDIVAVIAFLLLYRFAEAQLVKMVAPFLLDPRAEGRAGADDGGGGDRLRDRRGDRAHARGTPGRLGHLPEGLALLALDHGLRDAPAGRDLHLALPGACRRAFG